MEGSPKRDPDFAVRLRGVGKQYLLRRQQRSLTLGLRFLFDRRKAERFWALRDIDLQIARGETLGVIGPNGSGKSTLLKILSGVTATTAGQAEIRGRVSSLLELGAGFHPNLTGRENIYLNGTLLGMSQRELDAKLDSIIEFSGLARFIDTPIKDYSSGMYLRLAFAIAAHSDPEILILDEIMTVGDEEFQRKSSGWIRSFRQSGRTIVFVSHDMKAISAICDRVMLLDGGRVVMLGETDQVIRYYLRTVGSREAIAILRHGQQDAVFNAGQISLFHQGHEITIGPGLSSAFQARGLLYLSFSGARWEILKRGDRRASARAEWTGSGIGQTWDFGYEPDGSFIWRISTLTTAEGAAAEQLTASLNLVPRFRRYLSPQEEGEIPEITPTDREDRHVTPWLARCRRLVLEAPESPAGPRTGLELQVEDVDLNPTMAVLNSAFSTNGRILRASSAVDTRSAPLTQEPRLCFHLRVRTHLSAEELTESRASFRRSRSLQLPGFELEFRHGCGLLTREGRTLTTGLGLYTSLCTEEGWFDSKMGDWDVQASAGGGLDAMGRLTRIGVFQSWSWKVLQEGAVEWEVLFRLDKPLRLTRIQANLMLDSPFRSFRHADEEGLVPERFLPDVGEDWELICSRPFADNEDSWISLSTSGIEEEPMRVTLQTLHALPGASLNIVNSDDKFGGRLLQCLTRDVELPSGETAIFRGVLRVAPEPRDRR